MPVSGTPEIRSALLRAKYPILYNILTKSTLESESETFSVQSMVSLHYLSSETKHGPTKPESASAHAVLTKHGGVGLERGQDENHPLQQ